MRRLKPPFERRQRVVRDFFSGSAALKVGEHRRSVAESDETFGSSSSSRDEVTVKLSDLVGAD